MKKPDAKKAWIIYSILIIIFFLAEMNGLDHYDTGDENVYFYMAKLVAEGKLPYRDFFFAHPPLHLFFVSVSYILFGFHLVTLKMVPLLAVIVSSFFLFRLMKERFSSVSALIAVFLFLFSFRVMLEATYFLGVNVTTMFMVIGFYFLFSKKNYFAGGVFFGLAGLTGLYSLPITATIMAYAFFDKIIVHKGAKSLFQNDFTRMIIGFLISFILVNVLFIIIFGSSFIEQVYTYHFLKPEAAGRQFSVIFEVIRTNWIIFASSVLGVFSLAFFRKRKVLFVAALISLAYLVFLTQLSLIFNFYFVLLFPFLAVLGSRGLVGLYSFIVKRLHPGRVIRTIAIAIPALFVIWNVSADILYMNTFDFKDFEGINGVNEFIIRNTDSDDYIFGDASIAPLIALYTGRELAFDMADTNDIVFLSGLGDLSGTLARIKSEDVSYVIIRPLEGIGAIPEAWTFLNENCETGTWLKDKYRGDFLVLQC